MFVELLWNFSKNLILAWPEQFQSGLVLGIEEASNCDLDGASVTLQVKSKDTAKQVKQEWIASTVVGTDYMKYRIRCSDSTNNNMVLSTYSPNVNNDNDDDNDNDFILSIKGIYSKVKIWKKFCT